MFRMIYISLLKFYLHIRVALDERFAARSRYNHIEIRLGGSYPEEPLVRPPVPFLGRGVVPTLLDALFLLDEARRDPLLRTVMVRIDPLSVGWARLSDLGRSLDAIRATGKRVFAYVERPRTAEYVLACHADEIFMPPTASLHLTGLRAEVLFLKDLLDRAGVKAEFLSEGKFKSAAEALTRTDLSKAARENLDSVLDSIYSEATAAIARGRKLEPERVAALVDGGPHLAEKARAAGLVDRCLYRHEARKLLRDEHGARAVRGGPFAAMAGRRRALRTLADSGSAIGVLVADGVIAPDRASAFAARQKVVTPRSMRRAIGTLRRDRRVRAVVLRVQSPGGDGLSSDLIHQELRRLAESKPLVVSMGDVAASGGYFLALAGACVFAEPATLTGSIGVLAGKLATGGLYEKFGLRKTVLTRGANADLDSGYLPFSDTGRARMREHVEFFYRDFVAKVAEARKMTPARARKLAQGRVWTGAQAAEVGLVDALGGLPDAIAEAKRRAGLPAGTDAPLAVFPRPRPWWRWREDLAFARVVETVSSALGLPAQEWREAADLASALDPGAPCALLPFRIRIF